jgi:hypothetical protein
MLPPFMRITTDADLTRRTTRSLAIVAPPVRNDLHAQRFPSTGGAPADEAMTLFTK